MRPRRSTVCTGCASVRCKPSIAASAGSSTRCAPAGQLDNTYIVFTSDNGFHLGQHRLPAGKQTAYDTDIHVPFLVRGPGITAGVHVARLAGNVDLAPTFEAMAGVRPAALHRRSVVAAAARR